MNGPHRRNFLKRTSVTTLAVWSGTSVTNASYSPNDKLNVAVIGLGGQGKANLNACSKSENIVALCDVDEQRAGNAFERFPKAKRFTDYRQMFDTIAKEIDAVVVSTPDHTHFHPSMIGMDLGKHLYCEKPMAHSVWEIRKMTELARKNRLATQLGVQRHTIPNIHRVVELVQSGAIGTVSEVHSWIATDRGMPNQPTSFPKVPAHLDWDLWLGPAKFREYSPEYAPYKWRFWWDFGTGETGNWACHILDIPFWALGLTFPTRVDALGPEVDAERTPKSMATKFQFPTSNTGQPVELHWYHAKNGPKILRQLGLKAKGNNTLFVGTKGKILCGFGRHDWLPDGDSDQKRPQPSIPDSPGFHREWIDACKGGQRATCHFDYSGPLSEVALLGNSAYRAEGGFDWNAETMTASGNSNADQYIRPTFRKGWEWNA